MFSANTAGTAGAQNRMEHALRLAPMATMTPTSLRDDGMAVDVDDEGRHNRIRKIALLCSEILRGSRPLTRLRRHANRRAFHEFSNAYRVLRTQFRRDSRTVVRVSRLAVGDESTEIVVTVRSGTLVRAVAMQARHIAVDEWRLTRCHLVGGY